MNSKSVYITLSFLMLVCVMGLSESSGQRTRNRPRTSPQATPANSPAPPPAATPTPTPTPTPPEKRLNELKATINGFGRGTLLAGQERTFNFSFSNACKVACKDCTLYWDFEVSAATVERFTVQVALSAIDPKRISVDGTQVEFETNNGQSITVYTRNPIARTDYTDAWHLSIRSEDGAEQVASLLKQVLTESCPKP